MISFLIGLMLGMMIIIVGALAVGSSDFENRYKE